MLKKDRILIVDDQPENITIMLEALQGIYDLTAATDGETALERAAGDPAPDLILLDVMMPGMNGHEVCMRLKRNPETADIPVIFVTALDNPDDEAKGLKLGAVDYITKPISPPVVEARIRAHLQLTHAKRILEHQNEVLEQRVKAKTADVVRIQKERVEGLNNFANAVAHQIRNPVMSIGGISGLMVSKTPPDSPLAEYAQAVRENSLRLESLVNTISEYVSLTAKNIGPIPAHHIVERALSNATDYAKEQGCSFNVTTDFDGGSIIVDGDLVTQAITEILKNSIDFAQDNRVEVLLRAGTDICDDILTAQEQLFATDCRYGIQIVDDGPGISDEHMPYLTDPFFTTKALGVGLGLTKAKRILCEELGGTMNIVSHPGNGTSVTMTFALGG